MTHTRFDCPIFTEYRLELFDFSTTFDEKEIFSHKYHFLLGHYSKTNIYCFFEISITKLNTARLLVLPVNLSSTNALHALVISSIEDLVYRQSFNSLLV